MSDEKALGPAQPRRDEDKDAEARQGAGEGDAAFEAGGKVVDQGSPSEPLLGQPKVSSDLGAIAEIPVHLSAVLGKASMPVNQLLRLGRGAVVELDRRVGEPIDILVNNRLVARGEVVVVDDRLGVTMTEIIKSDP